MTPTDFIILLSGILNFFLGAIIWFQDTRGRINIGFGVFALSTLLLIGADFVFRIYPSLLTLRLAYSFAALVPATGLLWVVPFAKRRFSDLPSILRTYTIVAPVFFFALPFLGTLMFKRIISVLELGYQAELGPLFPVYGLYFASYIFLFLYLLLGAGARGDARYRGQVTLVLIGILLYGVIASSVSLVLPSVFGIFDYTLLEAPSLIFFVGFTFYAIREYKLFNTKVIATELFIVLLSFIIFARIFFTDNPHEQVFTGFLLFTTVIIGALLMRSVVGEVHAREEVERLAEELKIKNVKLTELDKLKSQFLSIATHELRTPLTIVRNFIALILDGSYGKVPPAVEEGGRQVFERVTDMAHSVDTYLNVSRIEQGKIKYDFTPEDLTRLVTTAFSGMKANAEKKGLSLTLTVGKGAETMRGAFDAPKITEVLINLIDNSIKYTPKGSITATLEKAGPQRARLTIKDTGVGMTQKTMQNLFKLFSPGEDSKKINPASTGVGLYVSRAHAEAHKGTLTASSAGEGKGSQFMLELPIS